MNEQFLQYLWKYKLWNQNETILSTGEAVHLINQGTWNQDSGPDFFDARIKVGEQLWAGNIEIHINSSDWYTHKHHIDKAYDNVILHVSINHDKEICNSSGRQIPTLKLNFDSKLLNKYNELLQSERWIPCDDFIFGIEKHLISHFIASLTIERLERKTQQLDQLFYETKNNLAHTLFISIAKSLGTKLNVVPFELLAKSIPYNVLLKNKGTLQSVEAMLFGQAGFLYFDRIEDAYREMLRKEYEFQKHKLKLTEGQTHLWKFLRLRPASFPTIRIAQLADLIFNKGNQLADVLEMDNLIEIRSFFEMRTSTYWDTHFDFCKSSPFSEKKIGKETIDLIMINSIIPFIFAYGKWKNDTKFCDRALNFLDKIDSEKNTIIKQWTKRHILSKNAFDSQGLIELKNEYCQRKRCLECVLGSKLINNETKKSV